MSENHPHRDPDEYRAPASMSEQQELREAASEVEELPAADAAAVMATLPTEDAVRLAEYLDPNTAGAILSAMGSTRAAQIISEMQPPEAAMVLEAMPPDDRVDVLEHIPRPLHDELVGEMEPTEAAEVWQLEQYAPDTAGGIMTTEVAALPQDLTAEQAITELRRIHEEIEQIYYVYVVDQENHLLGVLSMRDLILARPNTSLSHIMQRDVVSVSATLDQEQVARLIHDRGFLALPVVDDQRHLLGLITVDDVVEVAEEEATEDIQKLGGTEALDAPYLDVGFASMVRKRGIWLSVLFFGEMLTMSAMGHFEEEIAKAVVLALFIPLIISSGGNSGSQAATLIVRSLALSELRLRDWLRVFFRELRTSLALGTWLGTIAFLHVVIWHHMQWNDYGPHYLRVGLAVGMSLTGVVAFGSLTGSMLPFVLRRLGLDPATSSAPFVATLVDVTGIFIYFSVALLLLRGTLL